MATFNNGFFTSDHSNIQILDNELHEKTRAILQRIKDLESSLNDGLAGISGETSKQVAELSDKVTGLSESFTGFPEKVTALSGNVASLSKEVAGLSEDATGISGDAAALVGDVAETIGDSDRIMLGCAIGFAVAVIALFALCFIYGVKQEKKEERNSSPANSNTPSGKLDTGVSAEETVLQPQQEASLP